MAGEAVGVDVQGFEWDYSEEGNINHLARHDVTSEDVEAVLAWDPLYFRNEVAGSATYVMVGQDRRGRSLLVFLRPTTTLGVYKPVTAWQSGDAHELLRREGRIS